MELIINPPEKEWRRLCGRNIPADDDIEQSVSRIIETVRCEGDAALRSMSARFDRTEIADIALSESEIDDACAKVAPEVAEAIRNAAANIETFHRAQRPAEVDILTAPGVRCVQRPVPIEKVGLYIPGGRAPLFSTVLMLGVPARIAGCREVVLCTPQSGTYGIAPEILYAARVCGITKIYRIGGAQAIAAMAYGTQSVPAVDKIFGPGNRYVTKAKQLLSRITAIDMPAGPSEVMVLADSTASPEFVAADMLSQAEHGPDSQAILVCDSENFARQAIEEIGRLSGMLLRKDSMEGSLSHSRVIVFSSRCEMIDFANTYAAEHLILSLSDPWEAASQITAAGSVFIGNFSPESAGDYASGTNHTLPTSGWARAFSGVNLDSFFRKITYQELTPDGLASLAPTIITMARAEGLDAHALAVSVRTEKKS